MCESSMLAPARPQDVFPSPCMWILGSVLEMRWATGAFFPQSLDRTCSGDTGSLHFSILIGRSYRSFSPGTFLEKMVRTGIEQWPMVSIINTHTQISVCIQWILWMVHASMWYLAVSENEVGAALPPALENQAGKLSCDWGGSSTLQTGTSLLYNIHGYVALRGGQRGQYNSCRRICSRSHSACAKCAYASWWITRLGTRPVRN